MLWLRKIVVLNGPSERVTPSGPSPQFRAGADDASANWSWTGSPRVRDAMPLHATCFRPRRRAVEGFLASPSFALGTVNFIFSPVTSQKTFLTGLGTCITNNVANNAALDAASQARYAVCAIALSVAESQLVRLDNLTCTKATTFSTCQTCVRALGTVNWIFSSVTSLQTFLTGLGTCITNNVANNASLDATSKARYTACVTSLSFKLAKPRDHGKVTLKPDTGFLFDLVEYIDDTEVRTESTGPCGRKIDIVKEGGFHKKNGERVSEVAVGAKATVGRAAVRWNLFAADAEGPHAGVKAYGRHIPQTPIAEVGAIAEASLGKAGVTAGPVRAEVNLNVGMGAKISPLGMEAKFLGFGYEIGTRTGINTPLGSRDVMDRSVDLLPDRSTRRARVDSCGSETMPQAHVSRPNFFAIDVSGVWGWNLRLKEGSLFSDSERIPVRIVPTTSFKAAMARNRVTIKPDTGFLYDAVEYIEDVEVRTESVGPGSYDYIIDKEGGFRKKNGKRVSEVAVGAKSTTGRAAVRWNLFSAEAEGPHAGVGAYGSHLPETPIVEVGAISEASLGKAGVCAGEVFALKST
ncbi:unnamed protein product [Darwinula stevensoni]|uniref:Uncharacterized protein n=1 Tax=Darwinula stevensoni TaxID=69355 RepID=A0A7R8XMR9_9CRUS|nr:unnamed protein product [Darwinula stevensoni]CAG0895892.1 unnamed protein product [Darwinula stevensoni]